MRIIYSDEDIMKITSSTNVSEAMKASKKISIIFRQYDLDCPGCRGSVECTVEKVAVNNGLDIKAFLAELNNALKVM